MADKADDVRQEIRKGRQDIADSRSAITEKLAILEDRIQETVDGVKHTFDLHYQVKQRPWLMFGGSLLMGYMIGRLSGVSSTSHTSSESSSRSQPRPGGAADTRNHFQSEIASIKNVVFGTAISTLWAMAKQVLLPPPPRNNPQQNPVPIPTSKTNGGRAL